MLRHAVGKHDEKEQGHTEPNVITSRYQQECLRFKSRHLMFLFVVCPEQFQETDPQYVLIQAMQPETMLTTKFITMSKVHVEPHAYRA
jgi:hypothetical protein